METLTDTRGLPCLNPKCKSHGASHYGCKCYGAGYQAKANGGEVDYFCSKEREHQPDCEYFDGGGLVEVPPEDMPDNSAASALPTPSPSSPSDSLTPVPPEDMPDTAQSGTEVPTEDLPEQAPKSSYLEQASTAAEQLMGGLSGGLTKVAETVKGLKYHGIPIVSIGGITTPAEIQARAEKYPGTAAAANIVGTLGLIAATGGASEAASMGSAAIQNAIQMGGIQATDELSNYLLGQSKDPSEVAASILVNGVTGGLTGGLFNIAGKSASWALRTSELDKIGSRIGGFLAGVGYASKPELQNMSEEEFAAGAKKYFEPWVKNYKMDPVGGDAFDAGEEAYNKLVGKLVPAGIGTLGAWKGYEEEGIPGALKGGAKGLLTGLATKAGIKVLSPLVLPILGKTVSTIKLPHLIHLFDMATDASKGTQAVSKGVENLFKSGFSAGINSEAGEKEIEKLRKYIEEGQQNKEIQSQLYEPNSEPVQEFAEGGEVFSQLPNKEPAKPILQDTDAISTHYPELGMALGVAKGRVNNYLNSQRPMPSMGKPAFDNHFPDAEKERSYTKALKLAVEPLSILNHVKEGTLTPEHMQHFTGMYPELHDHLAKKMTERITKAQMEGKKPSYRVRQSMSMFLGTDLDSTLTPANIMAAQQTFLMTKANQLAAQQPPPGKNKKGTSSLSKSSQDNLTNDQARAMRQQKV